MNKFLYQLSIRGLGILNYQNEALRGENFWLKKYLTSIPEPFVVDVGANVGNYCRDIIKINSTSQIIAIEPHPSTYNKLEKNMSLYKDKVFLINKAVGDTSGNLKLFDYKENDGSEHASLYEDVIKDLHKGRVISHEVAIDTLDNLLKNNSQNIDLLKIDTEGNEYKVMLGASDLLKLNRIKAIHFEFNEMNIISKSTFKDFWDLLHIDFNMYRILPFGNLLPITSYSTINCEIYHYQNIICLKKNT